MQLQIKINFFDEIQPTFVGVYVIIKLILEKYCLSNE